MEFAPAIPTHECACCRSCAGARAYDAEFYIGQVNEAAKMILEPIFRPAVLAMSGKIKGANAEA